MRARCRRRGSVWDDHGGVGEADHALFQSPARRIGDASGSPESPAEQQRDRPVEARWSAAPRRSVARTRTTRIGKPRDHADLHSGIYRTLRDVSSPGRHARAVGIKRGVRLF